MSNDTPSTIPEALNTAFIAEPASHSYCECDATCPCKRQIKDIDQLLEGVLKSHGSFKIGEVVSTCECAVCIDEIRECPACGGWAYTSDLVHEEEMVWMQKCQTWHDRRDAFDRYNLSLFLAKELQLPKVEKPGIMPPVSFTSSADERRIKRQREQFAIQTTMKLNALKSYASNSSASSGSRANKYCRCERACMVDESAVDALVVDMETSHNNKGLCCVCPFCIGELDVCSKCHGAFITVLPKKEYTFSGGMFVNKVKDEVDEYAEEEFRGSPIDFIHTVDDCSVGGCEYCVGKDRDSGSSPKKTVPIFHDEDED